MMKKFILATAVALASTAGADAGKFYLAEIALDKACSQNLNFSYKTLFQYGENDNITTITTEQASPLTETLDLTVPPGYRIDYGYASSLPVEIKYSDASGRTLEATGDFSAPSEADAVCGFAVEGTNPATVYTLRATYGARKELIRVQHIGQDDQVMLDRAYAYTYNSTGQVAEVALTLDGTAAGRWVMEYATSGELTKCSFIMTPAGAADEHVMAFYQFEYSDAGAFGDDAETVMPDLTPFISDALAVTPSLENVYTFFLPECAAAILAGQKGKIISGIRQNSIFRAVNSQYVEMIFDFKYTAGRPMAGAGAVVADDGVPAEFYNLQGMRLAEPSEGICIVRRGNKVSKEFIRR